jgi:putative hydrolase of the HAD superfamily
MRAEKRDAVHFFTDADNTLWDTNAVYARAQLALLREVEKETGKRAPESDDEGLAFLRRLDQIIAAGHLDRLRYPPILLVKSLHLSIEGAQPSDAVSQAMASSWQLPWHPAETIARYLVNLTAVPPLRIRVREGLNAIATAGIVITVVSEERVDRCEKLLRAHDLAELIAAVYSISKTTEAFRELKLRSHAKRVVMVGDQLDRDIRAAAEAGFETFYFPGGFKPYWIGELELTANMRQISAYDEVVPYVLGKHPTAI